MQFFFIRHGQSTNNALWDQSKSDRGRSDDPDLTETGQRQAQRLAHQLASGNPRGGAPGGNAAGFGLTHLYTSLMLRSVATGAVVANTLHLPLLAWPDAHEEGGLYLQDETSGQRVGQAGKSRAWFGEHFPQLQLGDLPADGGWWNGRPFEDAAQRAIRARRFLDDLRSRHTPQDRVAVISHGGFFNQVLAALFGLQAPLRAWGVLYNTAISRIDFLGSDVNLLYLNRTDHLPEHLLT